jgi:hypothetical protein
LNTAFVAIRGGADKGPDICCTFLVSICGRVIGDSTSGVIPVGEARLNLPIRSDGDIADMTVDAGDVAFCDSERSGSDRRDGMSIDPKRDWLPRTDLIFGRSCLTGYIFLGPSPKFSDCII